MRSYNPSVPTQPLRQKSKIFDTSPYTGEAGECHSERSEESRSEESRKIAIRFFVTVFLRMTRLRFFVTIVPQNDIKFATLSGALGLIVAGRRNRRPLQ